MELSLRKIWVILFTGISGSSLFLVNTPIAIAAECGDGLSAQQVKDFQPQFAECGKKADAQSIEFCIQDFYITPCTQNKVNNEKLDLADAQRACADAAHECALLASEGDKPDTSDTTSPTTPGSGDSPLVNNGNCGKGMESVNGVCVPVSGLGGLAGSKNWQQLVSLILKILLTLVGVIAVVAIVIGGFFYITSGGNEEQAEKGRSILINAVIGLVIVILAYTIVTVITNQLTI